ncbi:cell division protein FtsQ/DivIB [Vibrio hippocampi]|uniref:Cell division protein FtsQ n=1 Tax=Vibrio hippocampi TaxID=654686 RepID=A0ABN8DHA8_9VIBR|nr:cell division protein FtsQ/DivIB [Vibrio hippocampi]CAH0527076.1 Cell division protein FtsQ [Vibrio hippocampi]
MANTSYLSDEKAHPIPLLSKHGIGAVFLVTVIAVIAWLLYSTISWMLDDQRLPLSKIVLQGELTHVSAADVQDAFGQLEHIGSFMSQDINVLQHSVEQIPWVSQASVRKQWPDTVKVFLTEYQAVAIWNGISLLDVNGVVFNGDLTQLEQEQAKLYGPDGSQVDVLSTYRDSNNSLKQLGLSISSLVLNDRRAWQIILDNGIRLELGKDSLKERLLRFIALYQELGDKASKVSYIDLRYDTGAAVGWYQDLQDELQDGTQTK